MEIIIIHVEKFIISRNNNDTHYRRNVMKSGVKCERVWAESIDAPPTDRLHFTPNF